MDKLPDIITQRAYVLYRKYYSIISYDEVLSAAMFGYVNALSSYTEDNTTPFEGWASYKIKLAVIDDLRLTYGRHFKKLVRTVELDDKYQGEHYDDIETTLDLINILEHAAVPMELIFCLMFGLDWKEWAAAEGWHKSRINEKNHAIVRKLIQYTKREKYYEGF